MYALFCLLCSHVVPPDKICCIGIQFLNIVKFPWDKISTTEREERVRERET